MRGVQFTRIDILRRPTNMYINTDGVSETHSQPHSVREKSEKWAREHASLTRRSKINPHPNGCDMVASFSILFVFLIPSACHLYKYFSEWAHTFRDVKTSHLWCRCCACMISPQKQHPATITAMVANVRNRTARSRFVSIVSHNSRKPKINYLQFIYKVVEGSDLFISYFSADKFTLNILHWINSRQCLGTFSFYAVMLPQKFIW